jgi:hypothetical protein
VRSKIFSSAGACRYPARLIRHSTARLSHRPDCPAAVHQAAGAAAMSSRKKRIVIFCDSAGGGGFDASLQRTGAHRPCDAAAIRNCICESRSPSQPVSAAAARSRPNAGLVPS